MPRVVVGMARVGVSGGLRVVVSIAMLRLLTKLGLDVVGGKLGRAEAPETVLVEERMYNASAKVNFDNTHVHAASTRFHGAVYGKYKYQI